MENKFMAKSNVKTFKIDFTKVTTLEDVLIVLKAFNINFFMKGEEIPPEFQEIFDKGFMVEIAQQKEYSRKEN